MPESSWRDVGRVLLGRWPSQVSMWGEEGISAYIAELQADGLTPARAIVSLRTYRPPQGKDFPPSVAQVTSIAKLARPTEDDLRAGLHGPRLRALSLVKERLEITPGDQS